LTVYFFLLFARAASWRNKDVYKTVGDTSEVRLLLMTNRKSHMRFRLTSRSTTLDDLDLL